MKNSSAIYLLFASNIISGFAQGISMIAIPWYFEFEVGNSQKFKGFYLVLTFLVLFWGLFCGTIIDRFSRKKIFIYNNLVCGLIIMSVAIFGDLYFMPDYLVLLVFGLTIFNYNIHYPNLYAFAQEISDQKDYGRINSYIEVQGQVTSMLAGAFAAILLGGKCDFNLPFEINTWSIQEIFLMDAISYFIGLILFLFIKYVPVSKNDIHHGSIIKRLKIGINYLKKNKDVFYFGFLSYMLFAFTLVNIHILLPAYVARFLQGGACVYASSEFFYSIGAIIAGLIVYRFFRKYNYYISVIILMLVISISFISITLFKSLFLFCLVNLLLGLTNAGVRILRTTYLFKKIPNNIIGRATSVFSSINIVIRMILIYILSTTFFESGDNVRFGYALGAILLIISSILLYRAYLSKKKSI